jgi:sporulation protein YlmC with PRC-barrel domain
MQMDRASGVPLSDRHQVSATVTGGTADAPHRPAHAPDEGSQPAKEISMKFAAGFGALALVVALSAEIGVTQQASPGPDQQGQGIQLQAKSLMGRTVRSQEGQDLGKVSDLMIDPKDGKVTAVVVSMGSRLGMGGQEMTVPWNGVRVARDQQSLVVTLDQATVPTAPARQDERDKK